MGVSVRRAAFHRRFLAVHEAGHVIAAQHFGAPGFGMIWQDAEHWDGCAIIPTVNALPGDQRRVKLIGLVTGRSNIAVLREALAFTLAMLARERPALIAMSRQIISESRCHAPETVRLAKLALSGGRRRREPWPMPSTSGL
jgi:hypothetical protein